MKRIFSLLLTLALVLGLCACGQNAAAAWQEQYDLGVKYLSEGNYEEAIIAFTAAIDIDPKRPEAYEKAAETYVAMGDLDSALAILDSGFEATGAEALLEQKEALSASNPPAEHYSAQMEIVADGMDVSGENLSVQIRDSRTATITISGLSLQDSYVTNFPDSKMNSTEYAWKVRMYGDQQAYAVSTSSWAFEPGKNETVMLSDMQHSVWRDDGDSWPLIGHAEMSYTEHSITWTFTIPEEYPSNFASVTRYEVSVFDKSQGLELFRTYEAF